MKTIITLLALFTSIPSANAALEERINEALTQREKDIERRLPKPVEIEDDRQRFTIEPVANGKFKFNDRLVDRKGLKLAIRKLQKKMKGKPLSATLIFDPSVQQAQMTDLFNLIAETGISDVNLESKKAKKSPEK